MVQALIQKNINLAMTADAVNEVKNDDYIHKIYRKSPFLVQAACYGSLDIFKILLEAGCDINSCGHICLSKRRNTVSSNVAGGAAYYGNTDVLSFIIKDKKNHYLLDVEAIESADKEQEKG